jgi:hypothetical protein
VGRKISHWDNSSHPTKPGLSLPWLNYNDYENLILRRLFYLELCLATFYKTVEGHNS